MHEDAQARDLTLEQLYVKDAFLVLRALCKLTMKPLLSERYVSRKSQEAKYEQIY
jgi:brefeldin A-inhibited guanine nucleotide-exchange protein